MNLDYFFECVNEKEDQIKFEVVQSSITTFVDALIKSNASNTLQEQLAPLMTVVHQFLLGQCSSSELAIAREKIWNLYDLQTKSSSEQSLVRLVVSAFYDQEASEVDLMGYEFFFETLLSLVDEFDSKLVADLVAILDQNLKLS